LLKRSKYMGQAGWKDDILLAQQSLDPEDGMQKELVTLIQKAKKIYGKVRHSKEKE
jgi:Ca-activated chloride channel homolog